MQNKDYTKLLPRIVLFALVAIHFILPFTPVNPHPETRVVVASLILGSLFFGLALYSYKNSIVASRISLGFLLFVYFLSAMTGKSPVSEGFIVKLLFALGLLYGAIGKDEALQKANAGAYRA